MFGGCYGDPEMEDIALIMARHDPAAAERIAISMVESRDRERVLGKVVEVIVRQERPAG